MSKIMLERQSPFRRFTRDEDGVVAITMALVTFVIFVFTGAGIDTTRWLQARRASIDAMEAATLAGLREYQESGSKTKAEAQALASYKGNTRSRIPVKSDNVSFELVDNGSTIKMISKGNALYQTAFLSLVPGLETLPVVKMDATENPVSELAVGQNSGTSLEVSLMLDITGSMGSSAGNGKTKLQTMKDAAKKLIDIVVWDDQSKYTSKVALVPFAEAVNLGNTRAASARLATAPTQTTVRNMNSSGTTTWRRTPNCVVERTGTNAFTDVAYTAAGITPNYTTSGSCTTLGQLMPLDSDRNALKATIDAFTASGATAGQIGTAWAWYTLAPNFNPLWGNAKHNARPYSDINLKNEKGRQVLNKIAVLMTDGEYNTQYCNSGTTSTSFIGMA
ncbi:MAG: pilus assembly protein, partial [Hyphomicrobiaceae bacterium]|nr:pilus assembly protein [Hyphomicrobiaceae bacterium]